MMQRIHKQNPFPCDVCSQLESRSGLGSKGLLPKKKMIIRNDGSSSATILRIYKPESPIFCKVYGKKEWDFYIRIESEFRGGQDCVNAPRKVTSWGLEEHFGIWCLRRTCSTVWCRVELLCGSFKAENLSVQQFSFPLDFLYWDAFKPRFSPSVCQREKDCVLWQSKC